MNSIQITFSTERRLYRSTIFRCRTGGKPVVANDAPPTTAIKLCGRRFPCFLFDGFTLVYRKLAAFFLRNLRNNHGAPRLVYAL